MKDYIADIFLCFKEGRIAGGFIMLATLPFVLVFYLLALIESK